MASKPPRLLFIPVSGSTGSGELQRMTIVANAARKRWPDALTHFVVSSHASLPTNFDHELTRVPQSPTQNSGEVITLLERFQADITLFDSGGRAAQYRAAKQSGSRTVFVSSRPSSRRRGFRWRRMRWLDQHWMIGPHVLSQPLGVVERLAVLRFPKTALIRLPTLFEAPDAQYAETQLSALGWEAGKYALWCPGGGGQRIGSFGVGEIFAAGACIFTAQTSTSSIVVAGSSDIETSTDDAKVKIFPNLRNAELIALIKNAGMAVVGGGSLLLQALAMSTPCLTVVLQSDQRERIQRLHAANAVLTAESNAAEMANAATHLWNEPALRSELLKNAAQLDLYNGLDLAVEALQKLLA